MSKRGAQGVNGEERQRYGGYAEPEPENDKPMQATAAQLARRKIASLKGRPKARSQSPATTGSIYGDAQAMMNNNPPPAQTAPSNPFSAAPPQSFNFGGMNTGAQNGTPAASFNSTPNFGFGGNNNSQPQPQTNSFGGQSTSFNFGANNGASAGAPFAFGQNQAQPAQPAQPASNGFNPSSSFAFGQQQQSQQNGEAPKTLFGASQPAAPAGNSTASIFSGLGNQQSQETPKPSSTSFSFGAQQPQQAPKPATSFSFGTTAATPKPAASFSFGQQPQQNGQQTTGAAKPTSSFSFGQQNGNKIAEAPKPATSNLFSGGFSQPLQQNGDKAAGTSNQNGFNPSTSSLFGQQPQTNGDKPSESADKPSTSNLFASAGAFTGFGAKPQQNPAIPVARDNDASMETPQGTPNKNIFGSNAPMNGAQKPAVADDGSMTPKAAIPMGQGGSLFDRISREPSQTAETPAQPTQTLFAPKTTDGATPSQQTSSLFGAQPAAPKNPFAGSSSIFTTPATPVASSFKAPEAPATAFKAPQSNAPPPAMPAPPKASLFSSAPSTAAAQTNSKKRSMDDVQPQHFDSIKMLNSSLLEHLTTQEQKLDWTSILQYYAEQAAEIQGKPAPKKLAQTAPTTAAPAPTGSVKAQSINLFPSSNSISSSNAFDQTPKASSNLFGQPPATAPVSKKRAADEQITKDSDESSNGSSLFKRVAAEPSSQTPKAPSSFGLFGQPPATAPVNKKRPSDEQLTKDSTEESVTSQRRKSNEGISYPKLPDTASNTAKFFQDQLDKAKADVPATTKPASSGFTPATTFSFGKPAATTDSSKPANEAPKSASSGGFKPSTGGFKPATATSASSSSFLSSFGQKAQVEAEKEKQRRKDEDFDSEDDDPEEWEQNYKEEQERKKKEIEEKAKTLGGFSFKAAAAADEKKDKAFGGFSSKGAAGAATGSDKADEKKDKVPAGSPAKSSLFSGIAPFTTSSSSLFSTPKPAGSNLFNFSKPDGDKDSAPSSTPAAAPPKFTSLFGAPAPPASATNNGTASIFSTASKPVGSFNFGAKPASAASASKDDAESGVKGEEEEAAPAEPQVEDMTALMAAEKEENEILYHVEKSKARKLEMKPSEGGVEKLTWVDKGVGPIWLLKNKSTDKTRVLLKVPPFGKAPVNFGLLPGAENMYRYEGMKGKGVMATFVDHMEEKDRGKLSQWVLVFGKEDDAKEMARILKEEQPE